MQLRTLCVISVRNKNSNTEGRSPNVVKVIFHIDPWGMTNIVSRGTIGRIYEGHH